MNSIVAARAGIEAPGLAAREGATRACAGHYVRKVGGEVLSASTVHTSVGRIELFSRNVVPQLDWHFCQPEMTLFWHRDGFKRMRGTVDGKPVDCTFAGKSRLSLFPRESEIKMAFDLQQRLEYAVIFFDPDKVACRTSADPRRARLTFSHEGLLCCLADLCREAEHQDDVFQLFAEGWALQALAHVARIADVAPADAGAPRGGLTARARSRVDLFIRDNLSQPMTLEQLSLVAGLSKRHFLRSFGETVGVPPHRYIVALRIEEAKRQLAETSKPVTDIALDCGFSHAQHFSASFRKTAGLTPSEYRQRAH